MSRSFTLFLTFRSTKKDDLALPHILWEGGGLTSRACGGAGTLATSIAEAAKRHSIQARACRFFS